MTTLKIEEKEATKIYGNPNVDPVFKMILEQTFGKDFFNRKITDRIKTFSDACEISGIDPNQDKFKNGSQDEIAYAKLKIIIEVLNEGWKPDWNDENQYKNYPWFYLNGSSGFRFDGVSYYYSASDVGSRLCFKSRELAEYATKQFISLYKDFFTL